MDHAYIHRGDGICEMCGFFARERWHTIIECDVVINLWERLKPHLEALDSSPITKREMGLGLAGTGDKTNLRNRLAYTLRSAVLAMRWIRIRDKERATNNIWGTFQTQLKRELVEDYWVAKTNGQLGDFSKKVLVAGVLGKLGENGFVQWNDWLRDIRVGYWNLFY